ncbi:unnamed protein product [Caenorhabditis auriculariae]|uniref:SKP1 component POZ domain-containing protein n=1 Tax=Caenorhabditis auriculariae TaxID=2777116 RepID=A0A8S1H5P1_9PELO|nr:unnamed protein product [Caenorhabditis auriculariae]
MAAENVETNNERKIKLVSADNETFEVPRDVIRLSNTINTLLQDLGLDDTESSANDPIPVSNVTSPIFEEGHELHLNIRCILSSSTRHRKSGANDRKIIRPTFSVKAVSTSSLPKRLTQSHTAESVVALPAGV